MDTPIIPNTDLNNLVYEPAEDSFLLLDALEQDLPKSLEKSSEILFTLEVGCGSGLISVAVCKSSQLINRIPCVFAADINPNACCLTQKTGIANNVDSSLNTILLDGTKLFKNPFKIKFDLILCNPPYVPIIPDENPEDNQAEMLQKSWDGGPDGNTFIIPFLSNVKNILKPDGILYMLLSSWNNPEMLSKNVAYPQGLLGQEIIKRAAGRERLSVWKFTMH